jgi:hypothetical protein
MKQDWPENLILQFATSLGSPVESGPWWSLRTAAPKFTNEATASRNRGFWNEFCLTNRMQYAICRL